MKRILIIDDDIDICTLLQRFLGKNGYETQYALSGKTGIELASRQNFDLAFCDFKLRDSDGRTILTELRNINPALKVIIITGYSDVKIAVDVIKKGAYDYIVKPLIPDEILSTIMRALNEAPAKSIQAELNGNNSARQANTSKKTIIADNQFIRGNSAISKALYKQIGMVAPTNLSVIIYGESGSGKENIARSIHHQSERKNNPFIAIDCGALTKELAGSELWGHEKGAFTGAVAAKPGQFELANGGTIFLDEIANLSYEIQVGLLRLTQERKLRRIGGTKDIDIDVRIIVASNEDLRQAVKAGNFREDLYFRFNEFSVTVPALRERGSDIMLFANHFLEMASEELKKEVNAFDDEVVSIFNGYHWPGNLREMRNVIRRATLLSEKNSISVAALPQEVVFPERFNFAYDNKIETNSTQNTTLVKTDTHITLKDIAASAEAEMLKTVLEEQKYNRTKAAKALGIDRKTLFNKMKQYNL